MIRIVHNFITKCINIKPLYIGDTSIRICYEINQLKFFLVFDFIISDKDVEKKKNL